jgi:hypothetical protein
MTARRLERRLFLRLSAASVGAAAVPTLARAAGTDAVGDGATDDTAALQDTFDAVVAEDGSVDLPAGTYLVTEPLWVDLPGGSITIRGEGADATVLRIEGAAADDPVVLVDGGDSKVSEVHFSNVGFESDAAAAAVATVAGEVGVVLGAVERASFEDCVFYDLDGNKVSRIQGRLDITFS